MSGALSVRRNSRAIPGLEARELAAIAETPSSTGARWISLRALEGLAFGASAFDPANGEVLDETLAVILRRLAQNLGGGGGQPPSDRLWQIADFCLDPLMEVLRAPRSRIERTHAVQPMSRIRELDARSMAWLSKKSGRSMREKIANTGRALAVVRCHSANTLENRLARTLLKRLTGSLSVRWEHCMGSSGGQGALPDSLKRLDQLQRLESRAVRLSPLSRTSQLRSFQPNNALLSDPVYSRLWRGWQRLQGLEEHTQESWKAVERLGAAMLMALVVGRLAQRADCLLVNAPARFQGTILQTLEGRWIAERPMYLLFRGGGDKDSLIGQVKFTARNDRGQLYGFITSAQDQDYYFNQDGLVDGKLMETFSEGDVVCFQGVGSGKKARAVDVVPARKAGLLKFEFKTRSQNRCDLLISRGWLSEQGWTSPQWESLGYLKLTSHDQNPEAGRGLPLKIRPVKLSRNETQLEGYLDRPGLEALVPGVSRILERAVGLSGEAVRRRECDVQDAGGPTGLDLSHSSVWEGRGAGDGVPRARQMCLRTSIWHIERSSIPSLWGGCEADQALFERRADQVEVCGVSQLFNESGYDAKRQAARRQLIQKLQETLTLSPGNHLAYTVPDAADEVSLRILRAEMVALSNRSMPVWRSVAATLGWERRHDRPKASPGDVVLVLDVGAEVCSLTPLVAKKPDPAWACGSDGVEVVWERRPAVPLDRLSELLGSRTLLMDFGRKLLKSMGGGADGGGEAFLTHLLNAGHLEDLYTGRAESVALPWEGAWWRVESGSALVSRARQSAQSRWSRHFQSAHELWAAPETPLYDVLQALKKGARTLHLLALGWILADRGFRRGLKSKFQCLLDTLEWRGRRDERSTTISWLYEEGELALGAFEVARRADLNLLTWREWLPELYIETIRGGHYDQLCLLEGESVDPALGEPVKRAIPESLGLPAGQNHYRVAVFEGLQHRRPWKEDLILRAPVFPTSRAMSVNLNLSYRYGVQDSYTFEVVASEPVARGSLRASTSWEPVEDPVALHQSLAPPVTAYRRPVVDEQRQHLENLQRNLRSLEGLVRGPRDMHRQGKSPERKMRFMASSLLSLLRQRQDGCRLILQSTIRPWFEALGRGERPSSGPCGAAYERFALSMWASMGQFAPDWVDEALCDALNAGGARTVQGMEALSYRLRAAPSAEFERLFWRVADWERLIVTDYSLFNRSIETLGELGWHDLDFLLRRAVIDPSMPQTVLRTVTESLQRLNYKVRRLENLEHKPWKLTWPLKIISRTVLALLNMRRAAGLMVPLRAGQASLRQLARSARQLEGHFVRMGVEERLLGDNSLKFPAPPDHLRRVSPLLHALSFYLTGEDDVGTLRVR